MQVFDIFVTDMAQYRTGFSDPANWTDRFSTGSTVLY
jgi:hypothetical protein